jgi:preprotein translocase subunit YajC
VLPQLSQEGQHSRQHIRWGQLPDHLQIDGILLVGQRGFLSSDKRAGTGREKDFAGFTLASPPVGSGVLLALIVRTVLGGRREKKKFEAMMSSIKKNDQVRTVGGIIGSVVEVKPDVVVLKIDENSNTKITVVRSKIEAVMKESTASA